jgi:CheY-like chemotaxis protein
MTHKILFAPADGGSAGSAVKREPLTSRVQKRLKATIIDDDPSLVHALRLALEGRCDVPSGNKAVRSFEEVRKLLEDDEPDLIICDKKFDDSDPCAHAKTLLLSRQLHPDALVILHTGVVSEEDEKLGFDAIVLKGNPDELLRIVRMCSPDGDNCAVADEIEEITDKVGAPPCPEASLPEDDVAEWDHFSSTNIEKKGTLLVIERDNDAAIAYGAFFSTFFEVPEPMQAVGSYSSAEGLLRNARPGLVVIIKGFDQDDPQAHLRLLDFAKELDPEMKVILYGTDATHEDGGTEKSLFDAVIEMRVGSADLLMQTVRKLAA